jgi:hypothetical protein
MYLLLVGVSFTLCRWYLKISPVSKNLVEFIFSALRRAEVKKARLPCVFTHVFAPISGDGEASNGVSRVSETRCYLKFSLDKPRAVF